MQVGLQCMFFVLCKMVILAVPKCNSFLLNIGTTKQKKINCICSYFRRSYVLRKLFKFCALETGPLYMFLVDQKSSLDRSFHYIPLNITEIINQIGNFVSVWPIICFMIRFIWKWYSTCMSAFSVVC